MVAISPFVASKLTVSLNKKERLLLKITALITKTQRKQADFKLKKKHGQIEFVRTNCPAAYNLLIFRYLQVTGQKSRTNSICPCCFFSLIYSSYLFIHLLIIIRIVYALHKDLTVFNLIS